MLRSIDPTVPEVAERIVQIQRAAYAIEAELIGFDGIPQLSESPDQVRALGHMNWTGAFANDVLVGIIAWTVEGDTVEVDRLAVHPEAARRGFGRQLVRSVPSTGTVLVSTGVANEPAVSLYLDEGFERVGSVEVAPNIEISEFRRVM